MSQIDSLGYNYGSDPAFLAALSSYNPNFKSNESEAQALALAKAQLAAASGGSSSADTTATTNPAAYAYQLSAKEEESDNTGWWIGGGLAAAVTVGAMIKGKGNPIKGVKSIWNSLRGKTSEVASEAASKGAREAAKPLESMKVVLDKSGRPVYYLPGKTVATTDASKISSLLGKDKDLKMLTGLKFNSGETTINGARFTLKDGGNSNTIEFLNDKIVSIKNGAGKDITSSFVDAGGKLKTDFTNVADTEFASKIEDHIAKIRGGNVDAIFNKELALADIRYTTKIGDQSAEVFRNAISTRAGEPEIKKLTTLKEFNAESDEVLAYIRRAREQGSDISSVIAKDFVVKHKLPEGYKVGTFELRDGSNIIQVSDGKAVGVTIGGVKYGKDHDKFLAYMEKHEKSVEKMISNALKNNNIPKGATIVPQAA